MPRRIDVELTSARPDGSWTWRAAGAKQPKGELVGTLLPPNAKVGDVLNAEVEIGVDGIDVVAVAPPKADKRPEPERITLTGSRRNEELVTTVYADRPKGRGGRDQRDRDFDGGRPGGRDGRRPGGGGRDGGGGRGRDGERRPGSPGEGRPSEGRPSGGRPGDGRPSDRNRPKGSERNDRPDRGGSESSERRRPARRAEAHEPPRLKRLKAGRKHRNAVVRALPTEQKPLAQLLLRGGIAEVRAAIDRQNALAKADGLPLVSAKIIESVADKLAPLLRSAEWYDRAEAARTQLDSLDLRDLRSVVVAADSGAKDDTARGLAADLRSALSRRVEEEHTAWLAEIAELLADGRSIRALRLSSRPPKAGAPLPTDMAQRLAAAASTSLTSDTFADRYAVVVEAVAFSPVRLHVVPQGVPTKRSDELTTTVTKLAGRVPQIAELFGIEPAAKPPPSPVGNRSRPGQNAPRSQPGTASTPG